MRTALQLYGIVPLEPGISLPVEGTSLVGFRAIAAVVSPSEYRRRDPDEQALTEYADVVEAVFARMPILPAPPGTVFRSRSILSRWLELHYVTLTDALSALEGSAAARVTIVLREGPLDDRTVQDWQRLASESLQVLRTQAAAMATAEENGQGDSNLMARTSFLVARENWSSFEQTIGEETRRHPHLEYTLTGPWPPYDFVRMQFGS